LTWRGEVTHSYIRRYRAPANVRGRSDAQPEARGFLDGDFLELYLSLPVDSKETDAVLEGANPAERITKADYEIRAILEGLQSLH
jgi:DNA damage-binding protein 1